MGLGCMSFLKSSHNVKIRADRRLNMFFFFCLRAEEIEACTLSLLLKVRTWITAVMVSVTRKLISCYVVTAV